MANSTSVGEALRSASSFLWKNSTIASTEPDENRREILRGESETMLQWCARWRRTDLLVHLAEGRILPEPVLRKFEDIVCRRAQGIPLQYLLGETGFYGRQFRVRPGCLIPRPETEWLVEAALNWLHEKWPIPLGQNRPIVLDVGTGSGAIAVTLALEFPQAEVHAVDISKEALTIAKDNARALGANVIWHEGDGLELLTNGQLPISLLVSNPPYIPSDEVDELEVEVRHYEPRRALDGGQDGLDFYRRIASLGDRGVTHQSGGTSFPGVKSGTGEGRDAAMEDGDNPLGHYPAALFLEVGAGQAHAVESMFAARDGWRHWRFRRITDLRGIERVVAGELKG